MGKHLKREALLYGASKYSTIIISLLTTAVLSRILTPEAYGVVSVVTVFTSFFAVLSDMGLGTAVIQSKTITDDEVNDVFSFSVYISVAMALLFFGLGYLIALFYANVVYREICAVLSISVLFNSMNIIPNAVMMKRKRFSLVGKRLILTSLLTGAAAIVMAWRGFGYYALILQSVFQSVFIFAWNARSTHVRFRAGIHMSVIHQIRNFSLFQFLFSLINYFARNADNLLVGKVMGSTSLAYYDKGYRLMMYPVQNLTYVINPILHPVLAEYQNNKQFIYDSYKRVVMVLSYLGVLISAICFLCGEEIILLFFGSQWGAAVPVFKLLSLSVWPQLVSSSAGAIYQSTGNTKWMFRSGVIHFGVAIALIVCGVLSRNLLLLAAFVTIGLYLRFFIDYYFLMKKDFGFSYKAFLGVFRYDLLAAACMAVAIVFLRQWTISNALLSLLIKCVILLLLYGVVTAASGEMKRVYYILKSRENDT